MLDQLGVLTQHAASERGANVPITLAGRYSSITALAGGTTAIHNARAFAQGRYCGVGPAGGPAVVSTTGLRWNLDATRLRFGAGARVSSSNEVVYEGEGEDGTVVLEANAPVLWTATHDFPRGDYKE